MQARKWIIPVILVSLFILILSLRQLSDPDLGFHLKYGRWIAENHRVPMTDLSTFTVADHSYTDLHWLFQLILYGVYSFSGYPGISIFVCLLALLLSLFIMLRNRMLRIHESITALALLAGFLIIDPRIAPRPEMFTFLFLTGLLLILDAYTTYRKNYLYLLPVIMLLWCNMHALFVLGLIVTGITFLSQWFHEKKPDRTLLIWLGVSAAVCLINPYGFKGFSLPIELLTRFDPRNIYNQHIQEFMPFFSQPNFVTRDYLFLLLLAVTLISTVINRRHGKIHEVVLLIIFAFLAIGSVRNIPLFVLVALPIASRATDELCRRVTRGRKGISTAFFIFMVLLSLALIPRLITNNYYAANNSFNKTGLGIDASHQPVEAADFIKNNHLEGKILNSIGYGGWLSWVLPQPVFIDGRLEVMQESLYREITASWNGGLPALAGKYKPGIIVYNYLKYYPWTMQLKEMPGWRLVYVDGSTAIFIPDTTSRQIPATDLENMPASEGLSRPKSVTAMIGSYFMEPDYGALELSHKSLFHLQMARVPQPNSKAITYFNRANMKREQGDIHGAIADYDTAISINPAYVKAFNNRGILRASANKDFNGAISDFNKAIELDSTYSDAYLGRGTANFYTGNRGAACRDWQTARSLGNVHAVQLIRLHCNGK